MRNVAVILKGCEKIPDAIPVILSRSPDPERSEGEGAAKNPH
jgi:hypothetical protein